MRLLILSAIAVIGVASCNHKPGADNGAVSASDTTFTISGIVQGLDTGKVIFIHRPGDTKIYDTVEVKQGKFQFTGSVPASDGVTSYTCFIDGKSDASTTIMTVNAKITLTAKADAFDDAVVSGSPAQDDYNSFDKITAPIDSAMRELGVLYDNTKDKKVIDSIDKVYDHYDSIRQSFVPAFVKEHSHSVTAAYIVSRTLLINPKIDFVEPVYNTLDRAVKQSKYGKIIADVLDAAKKTAVGQTAPDFTMNDRDGKPVSLSSFRGKFIFLDFWASWCRPCRKENPNIVAAYAKFHSAKFDILGVSLDTKKEKWEEAIAQDKLTWNHISDLKGWGNAAGKIYGIRAIPANLLLDKDGKILARNLYGSDLDKKLAEVLK